MTARRGARRNNQPSAKELLKANQKREAGFRRRVSTNPNPFVRAPWNSRTFSATYNTSASTTITINVGAVRQQLISQMGLAGAPGAIALKILEVSAWNTSVGPNFPLPSMEGLFWELATDSGGSYSVRSEQYDHGTLNTPAQVNYTFPLADRKEVHTASNDAHVIARFVVPSTTQGNGNVTVRVKFLWNMSAVSNQLNISDPSEPLPIDIDSLHINSDPPSKLNPRDETQ